MSTAQVRLRDYQVDGVAEVERAWARGVNRPGVDMATGLGKTAIMGEVARRRSRGRGRVCVLVHRDTLVEQTVARFREQLDAGTSIGVLKAERDEIAARVIVASVHSLRRPERRRRLAQAEVETVIVDEAHVSVSPTYRAVYRDLGVFEPGGPVMAGFSATWSRSDSTGLGDVWQEIVFTRSIKWGVKNGFLVQPRGIQVGDGVDLTGVRVRGTDGDYRDGDLERVVMLEEIRDLVVAGALRHAADRPGVLFAPTIDSAEYFAAALTEAGLRTEGIYATTEPWRRRQRFADHRSGKVAILSTCTALAEGWDAPWTSAAHYVRPTRHAGLFIQTAGRVFRPWPGKADALLLDYVGVLDDMSLRSAVDLSVSRETADGDELPDDKLVLVEPAERERTVRRRRVDLEVELFAGTTVQWLQGPAGIPFVPCGDHLVALVEGADGWNVAEVLTPGPGRQAGGRWVAEGLSSESALAVGSDHAEELGEHLSRRSAAWRKGQPSEAQLGYAVRLGIDAEGLTRGQLSDQISAVKARYALAPLASWQLRTREHAG